MFCLYKAIWRKLNVIVVSIIVCYYLPHSIRPRRRLLIGICACVRSRKWATILPNIYIKTK